MLDTIKRAYIAFLLGAAAWMLLHAAILTLKQIT